MFCCDIDIRPGTSEELAPEVNEEEVDSILTCPWRISQLAKHKYYTPKYIKQDHPYVKATPPTLARNSTFYSDQISRPYLRILKHNYNEFQKLLGPKFISKMKKRMELTWHSIYNYYKRELHERQMERQARIKSRQKRVSRRVLEARARRSRLRIARLARPKPLHLPKPPRKRKPKVPWDVMYADLPLLAEPKKHYVEPPRELGKTEPNALHYMITPETLRLTQPFERNREPEPLPLVPGVVRRSALFAKPSERVLELAKPRIKKTFKDADESEDPWAISPNALKYKASKRIKELAKPIERD